MIYDNSRQKVMPAGGIGSVSPRRCLPPKGVSMTEKELDNMKKGTKWIICAALCLALPACALAVTEGVVEDAPMVEMESAGGAGSAAAAYLPDASYYTGYGDWLPAWEDSPVWVESEFDGECYYDVEQRPRMTAGEAERAKVLLTAYQAGMIAYEGESILNKMEDVIVGVYALDPAEYDGERAYVILPGPCMTDEQLLAVIAAYDELGLAFDPDALNYRNCARGGGIETNRFLTEEERTRHKNLAHLIERGLLDVSGVTEKGMRNPRLDSRYFCGMTDFTIRPYRVATDEEFAAQLVASGYRDRTGEIDYAGIERESRKVLNGRLGAALSMELGDVSTGGAYVPSVFDANGKEGFVWGESRGVYGAYFIYYLADGTLVHANATFDKETKQLVSASCIHDRDDTYGHLFDEVETAPADDVIMEEIRRVEERLGLSGLTWHILKDDVMWTNWGACIPVRAQMAENEWLTVYIGKEDGKEHGLAISAGTLVDTLPDDNMPVNG